MERLTRVVGGEARVMETKFNSKEAMQKAVNRLAELEDKLESGEIQEVSNRPLTIDELKALEVGDWVFIINYEYCFSTYKSKLISSNDEYFRHDKHCEIANYLYSDYGTKWLAYKNKEQAEADIEVK